MKRFFTLFLALVMMLQTGCGNSGKPASEPEQTPSVSEPAGAETQIPEKDVSAPTTPETTPTCASIQDMTAFLHGIEPSEAEVKEDGMLSRIYQLDPGCQVFTEQYMQLLVDHYDMELIKTLETDHDEAFITYYYLNYVGPATIQTLYLNQAECNFLVGSAVYKDDASVQIGLYMPKDADYVDHGHRADLSAVVVPEPEPAPPEVIPEPEPAAPVVTPEPKPSAPAATPAPKPAGPEVIPDFLKNDISGAFRAGNSAFDNAVAFLADDITYLYAAEAYVQLLVDKGYQITDIEETHKGRYTLTKWFLYYEGADWPSIEKDKTTHVRVSHMAKHADGNVKTEFSIGYSEGITYGGEEQYQGGGGGGSSGGGSWDPYTPDASKLPCLTCRGSGDCKGCGGYGYVGYGSARAACSQCHRSGNCRTCGGSGTR